MIFWRLISSSDTIRTITRSLVKTERASKEAAYVAISARGRDCKAEGFQRISDTVMARTKRQHIYIEFEIGRRQ